MSDPGVGDGVERLFVYGSLRDAEVQRRVIGRVIAGRPDTLDGYHKKWLSFPSGLFPIIAADASAWVEGLVLTVTAADWPRLDAYETSAYRRIRVRLRSGLEAWAYAE